MDLVSVLNFMYMGEVNVAQDDLNQFLAVAEDLRVKGLTQGGGSSDNSCKSKSEPSKYPRPRESQLPSEPPSKRPRAVVPEVPSYEDEILEVLPVKSEPGSAPTAGASHYDVSQDQNQVALDDQYDESYDYGRYGEGEGYDDGSGVIDPNTGLPLQTTDGNKEAGTSQDQNMSKGNDGLWYCAKCEYRSKNSSHLKNHIEARHINA